MLPEHIQRPLNLGASHVQGVKTTACRAAWHSNKAGESQATVITSVWLAEFWGWDMQILAEDRAEEATSPGSFKPR